MRIRIQLLFGVYITCIAAFSSIWRAFAVISALIVHEAGHYAASIIIGEKIRMLEITPCGGILHYEMGKTPAKGIRGFVVAAFGPLLNYLCILAAVHSGIIGLLPDEYTRELITANLAMMVINLMPALPLDGGQMLFCVGYYFFPVIRLISVLSYIGCIVGLVFLVFALYGAVYIHTVNCSLIIIGIYLMITSRQSRGSMIAQNAYACLHERKECLDDVRRIMIYAVSGSVTPYMLLNYVNSVHQNIFVLNETDGYRFLTEEKVIKLFMQKPMTPIRDLTNNKSCEIF